METVTVQNLNSSLMANISDWNILQEWSNNFNESMECRFVKKLHDISTQCQFARKVDDCYDDSKIDYIQLTYCTLESQIVATLLFLFMLAFLFLAIGTTADDFLCPLLVSISKSLKLSDNIAGVTFLAFGNGAPDIFSSIIGIGNSDPNMVIGQLYGGGIFVTTIVVGSILIRERFQIMHRPLLRDITFYILTTSLVWVTFFLGKIELFNSLIFIGVYLIYVIVVIVSGVIYRKTRIIKDQESANGGEIFSKKGAVMPRDALKKSNKYKIQNHFNPQTISYNYNCDQEKVNRISIKSLYIPENSDTYEGVVLRRIKFRKYPNDPLFERRLTAYNISTLTRPKLNIPVIKRTSICDDDDDEHDSTSCNDLNNNNNNKNSNNTNMLNVVANYGDNNEIMINAKHLSQRRLTISDQNFPSPQLVSSRNNPSKSNTSSKSSETKIQHKLFPFQKMTRLFSNFCLFMSKSEKSKHQTQSDTRQLDNEIVIARKIETNLNQQPVSYNNLGYVEEDSAFNLSEKLDKLNESFECERKSSKWWKRNWTITLIQLCHFDIDEFKSSSTLARILMIVKIPIYAIFTITIPVVDPEQPMNGWNRPLNLIQLLLSPQCCLLITGITFYPLKHYQMHLVVLGFSFVTIPLVAITSHSKQSPSYHILFAYFGFIIAISWIYTIANEVVSLLKAIGVIFNLSQFMLGLTFLAWGNSIGDFISNLTVAGNGFPRMAISACFGGPVLNMLLGIGIPYTFLLVKQQNTLSAITLEYNQMISVMFGTITISLVTTIVILVMITKFKSSRIHGFTLYGIYAMFLTMAIVTEIRNSM